MAKKKNYPDWILVSLVVVLLVGVGSAVYKTSITGYIVKAKQIELSSSGAEEWGIKSSHSDSTDIPLGWDFKCYEGECMIGQAKEHFTGDNAVYIESKGGNAASVHTVYLTPRYEYTTSVWVKSDYEVALKMKRNDFGRCATTYHTGSGDWEKLTLKVKPTSYVPQGWDIIIDTMSDGNSLIWDNVELVQDTVSSGYREDKTLYR